MDHTQRSASLVVFYVQPRPTNSENQAINYYDVRFLIKNYIIKIT